MAAANPIDVLVTYGALGIMLTLLAVGIFRTRWELEGVKAAYDKQLTDKDATIAEQWRIISNLQQALTRNVIPAMHSTSDLVEAIPRQEAQVLDQVADARRDMAELLAQVQQLVDQTTKRQEP